MIKSSALATIIYFTVAKAKTNKQTNKYPNKQTNKNKNKRYWNEGYHLCNVSQSKV